MSDPLTNDDSRLGREAAERLCHEWPTVADLAELDSVAFANAAVGRLAKLIAEQPALFQASRRGSERGAESLSARPFQGILESIQNGDDLGANELRLAIRRRGRRRELLVVHDGSPISLCHVGAMVLPWVTTKADDPLTSGRFGVGQKTLRMLGGPIAAHCHPYHFRMDEIPAVCEPEPAIPGLYDPSQRETLLVVPLESWVDTQALGRFVAELGARALVFLRSIRRVSLIDLGSGKRAVDHRLREGSRREVTLQVAGRQLAVEALELKAGRGGRRYLRYLVEFPLKAGERRHNKATGPTTTLGVCVPARPEPGSLYDRVPLPVPCVLPVGLNAQFDPDAPRSTFHGNPWNRTRFAELGDLLAAVCLDIFNQDPTRAWSAIPLARDCPDGVSDWVRERYQSDVIGACQRRLAEELQLEPRGEALHLDRIVLEEAALDGMLTVEDQEWLAPDHDALPPEWRDRHGRWREVLSEFGRSRMLGVEEALELLDQADDELGPREPTWYIKLAGAAIEAEVFEVFRWKRGILLADGRRAEPPGDSEPRSLVCREEGGSLAARLGLALVIHPDYLAANTDARKVRGELAEHGLLAESYSADGEALALLARGDGEQRIRLTDDALLALRDALERAGEEEQRELGPAIGRNIELCGFSFDESGKRKERWVSPAAGYLPTQIDRETDSFARAAAKTPTLLWLSPDYARLLKRAGGRHQLGAQKLLVRLGAQTLPRLVPPPNELQPYVRDPRRVSPVQTAEIADVQATEIRALGQRVTHLLSDRWSPDLDAVIENIIAGRPGAARRRRAAALLGVLARGWERHYADHTTARAAWGYDGYWHVRGEVIATWLARAASEAWLPSATGSLRAPKDLHLPSEANRLTVGDKRSLYLMRIDDAVQRSAALAGLRIRRGPSASSVVSRLEELRDEPRVTAKVQAEVRTAYRLLALACPSGDGRAQRPIDDLTAAALRGRFAGGRGVRGLLLSDGRWYAPAQVFDGPPIFGRYRPFAPQSPQLEPLWHTLALPRPQARDCLAVLRELAIRPLDAADLPVVIETMSELARGVGDLSPQLRRQLLALPLWTGEAWSSARPMYAVADETLAAAIADQVPVWKPGFALDGMETLVEALGVRLLSARDFLPVTGDGYGAARGEEHRQRFALAVGHLRTELARCDQELYKTLEPTWEELAAARLVIDHELEVAATVRPGRRVVAPARTHLLREPMTVFARSVEGIGAADAGGRAIAELFSGDRQKVAWAWAAMWQRAEAGPAAERIVLSSDVDEDEVDDRLAQLRAQADDRRTKRQKTNMRSGKGGAKANGTKGTAVEVRQLKDLSKLQPSNGAVVNRGAPRGGIIVPDKRPRGGTGGAGGNGTGGNGHAGQGRRSTVLPPMSEREQLAYDAVLAALALDDAEVADLRHRRGVGADAVDELAQCIEIKMSSSAEVPSEITLTPAEVERARTDEDFFLAVVTGLEEGVGELRVRFIFDPLGRLRMRLRGDLTLGGVRDAEALEYVFPVDGDSRR
jgi:hypothetical protein